MSEKDLCTKEKPKSEKNAGLSARLSEPTEVSLVDKGHSDNEKTETEGCSGEMRRKRQREGREKRKTPAEVWLTTECGERP